MNNLKTGRKIYDEIYEKEQELNQYDFALKELKVKGTQYAPYILLNNKRQEIARDLNKLLNQEYGSIKLKDTEEWTDLMPKAGIVSTPTEAPNSFMKEDVDFDF